MKTLLITAAIAALAMPAAANAQHRGHTADTDGDKTVTLAEHDAAVAKRFAKMDGNGDGLVTEAEMKTAHEARKQKRAERMGERKAKMERRMAEATPEQRARMDEMRAKRAEMRELKREHRAERHDAMWAKTDTNGDGAISLGEFQAHARERFDRMDANDNGQIDADERRGKRHRGHGGPGHRN